MRMHITSAERASLPAARGKARMGVINRSSPAKNTLTSPLAGGVDRFLRVIALLCTIAFVSNPAIAKESAVDNYRTYCAQCHGLQGNGKGVNVRDMSVQPRDHTDAKAMSGRSDDDLFKVIKEGGLAIDKSVIMPPWGDTFSDEEIRDLVQHMRALCKCKYGK